MPRYIDAEQLKHIVNEKKYNARNKHFFFDCIYECDTADVAPVVHARWIEDGYQDEPYVCSNCGWAENDDMHRITGGYCVCCGAKMEKETKT